MKNNFYKLDEKTLRLNHPNCYDELSQEDKQALCEWIEQKFEKATRPYKSSSYGLKHDFERDAGIYVTNGAFKGAMLTVGFTPVNVNELNWYFKIKIKRNKAK